VGERKISLNGSEKFTAQDHTSEKGIEIKAKQRLLNLLNEK
jgi:hypothetical protein